MEGPWNTGPGWQRVDDREKQAPVDGGDGMPLVTVSQTEKQTLDQAAARTASRTDIDPTTGAELGAGPGGGVLETTKEP